MHLRCTTMQWGKSEDANEIAQTFVEQVRRILSSSSSKEQP